MSWSADGCVIDNDFYFFFAAKLRFNFFNILNASSGKKSFSILLIIWKSLTKNKLDVKCLRKFEIVEYWMNLWIVTLDSIYRMTVSVQWLSIMTVKFSLNIVDWINRCIWFVLRFVSMYFDIVVAFQSPISSMKPHKHNRKPWHSTNQCTPYIKKNMISFETWMNICTYIK